jgi:hypothetical protein
MPAEPPKAHRTRDCAAGRLAGRADFDSDRERVEPLIGLYERLVAPLMVAAQARRRRAKAASEF